MVHHTLKKCDLSSLDCGAPTIYFLDDYTNQTKWEMLSIGFPRGTTGNMGSRRPKDLEKKIDSVLFVLKPFYFRLEYFVQPCIQ